MGFGKWLVGGLCAVGAVVAAPVVLPAVGAAAAAGAAGVAAAGSAVATTVGGVAATVGSAVASTAVGGAVVSGAAAVGSAVGTAATAVGLTSVGTIAGTTAGAAALGAATTTGAVGAISGARGIKKMTEAKDIKESAQFNYDQAKEKFEKVQANTNRTLETLGKEKLKIWDSFNRFSEMYSQIQNPPEMEGEVGEDSIALTIDELRNIRAVGIDARSLLEGSIGSIAAGSLIGMATSGGLIGSVSIASTGTLMTSLSGAAASNAALAALGGGSLASGGLGMAGGAAMLSGLTVAPMLMVGGLMLGGKGKKALEEAENIDNKADQAIAKMEDVKKDLQKVQKLANRIRIELAKLNQAYQCLMDAMEAVVADKKDYNLFTSKEKQELHDTTLVLKLIKELSMQNIIDPEHENVVLADEVEEKLCYIQAQEENLAAVA